MQHTVSLYMAALSDPRLDLQYEPAPPVAILQGRSD